MGFGIVKSSAFFALRTDALLCVKVSNYEYSAQRALREKEEGSESHVNQKPFIFVFMFVVNLVEKLKNN